MNKVINIEIAKQVFWIEEQGYKILHTYLEKLKSQLADEECGDEIFLDIELRLAELLYGLNTGKERAITMPQLMAIIEQIGFVDDESLEISTSRKIYLDAQNKIMAGVCSGLSMRLGIPAFLLRLSFIGLIFVFGLGVLLYLIFWLSFEKNNTRNSALAAQGKTPTAKRIAASAAIKISPFLKLQRIIFLPFSLLGVIFNVIGNSFISKQSTYVFLAKNVVLLLSIFLVIALSVGIVEFNEDQIFLTWLQWLLSGATLYLMLLLSVIFIREYYIAKPRIKVSRTLKRIAILPVILISSSFIYLLSEMVDEKRTLVESNYLVSGSALTLKLTEPDSANVRARKVNIVLRTIQSSDNYVTISVEYFSNGDSNHALDKNIQAIDYQYSVDNNTLELNRYFELQPQAFNRGQRLSVVIEVPQNIELISSHNLVVNTADNSVEYELANHGSSSALYVTAGAYFHEDNEINQQRISSNERIVLSNKFCRQFFQQAQWRCANNIEKSVTDNSKFKPVFNDEVNEIEQIRQFITRDKVIELKELMQINELISFINKKYPNNTELHSYIQHLLLVKRNLSLPKPAPG